MISQCKEELCSIVEHEMGAKSVAENAACALEEWKRTSEKRKARKLDREREDIRDGVLEAFQMASSDFVSQLGNLDENVDVDEIFEVFLVYFH